MWGEDFNNMMIGKPKKLFEVDSDIVDLRTGIAHLLYLNDKGHVFSMGEGTYGETG